ncbi:MAG TPA: Sec-independent protein translocase subunit TatA [Streptosporangiaceae bacterium]|nr:Sec-independent protein translocase subunit TatA [Streptosporangiaceae bacterium]
MGDGLFAPWHIIILVVVLVLLFGATRLPGAARSLGSSMRIFKDEVRGLSKDDKDSAANPPPAAAALPAAPALDPTQQQLADLQQQVAELQKQSTGGGNGQAGQTQTGQPL